MKKIPEIVYYAVGVVLALVIILLTKKKLQVMPKGLKYASEDESKKIMIGKSLTRGQRNNNPGNFKQGPKNHYKGTKGKDSGGFVIFESVEYGYRAMIKLLWALWNNGHKNLYEIISIYAPASENNVDSYVSFVSKETGLSPRVDFTFDVETVSKIIIAMSKHESAFRPTEKQLSEAWTLSHDGLSV